MKCGLNSLTELFLWVWYKIYLALHKSDGMKKDHSKEKLATSKELKFRNFVALFKSIHLGTVPLTRVT